RIRKAASSLGTPEGEADTRLAIKRIDMAAAKGIIHPNSAARRKSRLMRQANAAK
ncbi:MAG: Ribosomal protein, partial [Actinomycetota bacterium]